MNDHWQFPVGLSLMCVYSYAVEHDHNTIYQHIVLSMCQPNRTLRKGTELYQEMFSGYKKLPRWSFAQHRFRQEKVGFFFSQMLNA